MDKVDKVDTIKWYNGSMDAESEVQRLLAESGAVLSRDRKHEIWSLPNGRNFVRPKTPSDFRSARNSLSDLRRELGVAEKQGEPGERRERKPKRREERPCVIHSSAGNTTMREKLLGAGVVEATLRETVAELRGLTGELAERNTHLQEQIAHMEDERCWWCRIKLAVKLRINPLVKREGEGR
jgi:hypothetical protein